MIPGIQRKFRVARWFKKRNNIKFKSIVREAGLVVTGVVDNWLKNILSHFLIQYYPDDIHNADETALFYKALPNKKMTYKNLDANSVEVCKERLSLLLCENMSGKDK